MEKELYKEPEIEIISFETEDIITESTVFTVDSTEVTNPFAFSNSTR